jgi:WD40 repeat protein
LITTSPEGLARLWDVETGELLNLINTTVANSTVSWAPDNRLAAIGTNEGTVIWDTHSGEVVIHLNVGDTVQWSRDSQRVFVSCNRHICAYDLATSQMILRGVPGTILSQLPYQPAWSPDGKQFARGFPDGSFKVWDAKTLEEIYSLEDGYGSPGWISWSPDGKRLLTGSGSGPARIWDAASRALLVELIDDRPSVYEIETFDPENPPGEREIPVGLWSPDGSIIVTNSASFELMVVWDAVTGEMKMDFTGIDDEARGGWISSWSPDGTRVASSNVDNNAIIWDPFTGETLVDLFPSDHEYMVAGVGWSQDSTRVAFYSGGSIFVFDAFTGELQMKLVASEDDMVFSIIWAAEDSQIYTCDAGGSVRGFDLQTGNQIRQIEIGGRLGCALSPDGSLLLIASTDGTTQIYPIWRTSQDLIDYAKECCIFRDLTPEEKFIYGLAELLEE